MNLNTTFNHTSGQTISCGDAEIYIEEIGNPELPTLLMLHGGFGNIEDFNSISTVLCKHFKLIGIDSRGHGKSSIGEQELSYKLLTGDLVQVIDSLNLKEFSIMGFSDGGIVAYRYAATQDPRLHKIVTIGSHWEIRKNDPSWAIISRMTGDIWKQRFPSTYESYMRLNPHPDFDHFAKLLIEMWKDLTPDGYPEDLMRQIDNEMLIVRGDNDRLTTFESFAKLGQIVKNGHFLIIPFADHVAFDDAPEIFLQAVGKFLNVSLASPSE